MPVDSREPFNADDVPIDPIELAAAEWLVQRDRGMDATRQQEFDAWLRADARHGRAFAQLDETWRQLDVVPAERIPLPPARRPGWAWLAGGLAAAAAIAFAFVITQRNVEPDLVLGQRTATAIGGFERLELPDGSVVRLNTASEITVDFTAQERRVTLLHGEASFDVEKDKVRPFVVHVDGVDVRAVGTAFNVRRQEHAIDVLVTEGRVQIADAASGTGLLAQELMASPQEADAPVPRAPARADRDSLPAVPLLAAGQRATIRVGAGHVPTQASVANIAPAEAARALAWRSRRLEFSAEPLANIAAEFNRYNRHRLVIADAELGAQRFGGKFPADDFETLVRLLETNFGVVVERHENETVLRQAPARR